MQSKEGEPTIALLGDSHALSVFYGLAELSKENPAINILNLRRDSSYFMKNVGTSGKLSGHLNQKDLDETTMIANQAYEIIAKTPTIESVILVLRGSVYYHEDKNILRLISHPEITDNKLVWQIALQETVSYLLNQKKRVIVILDWPELTFDPKLCVDYNSSINNKHQTCQIARQSYENEFVEFKDLTNKVLKDFSDVLIFDAVNYFCDNELCYAKRNGDILYKDREHLSVQGSLFLGKFFMPILKGSNNTNTKS